MNVISETAYEKPFKCICLKQNSSLVKKAFIFGRTFIDSYSQIPCLV